MDTTTARAIHTRRTSQYSLAVPAPAHLDADRHAALDALRDAATATNLTLTGVWLSPAGDLCVSWRSVDDNTAALEGRQVLTAYGAAEPADARMWTGFGAHRRDFTLDA